MKDTWSDPPPAPTTPTIAPASARKDVTGRRVAAGFIDIFVLVVWLVIFISLFGESTNSEEAGVSVELSGTPFIVFFISCYLYYFLQEAFWNGQTLGKKVMKLRVVGVNGPLTLGAVLVRTLLRFVDGLPAFYLVGIIAIVASKDRQRLGDMAAGTLVAPAETNIVRPGANSP